MFAVSVSEMEWIAEAMVSNVKALLARAQADMGHYRTISPVLATSPGDGLPYYSRRLHDGRVLDRLAIGGEDA
jgi:hypothetical protein